MISVDAAVIAVLSETDHILTKKKNKNQHRGFFSGNILSLYFQMALAKEWVNTAALGGCHRVMRRGQISTLAPIGSCYYASLAEEILISLLECDAQNIRPITFQVCLPQNNLYGLLTRWINEISPKDFFLTFHLACHVTDGHNLCPSATVTEKLQR